MSDQTFFIIVCAGALLLLIISAYLLFIRQKEDFAPDNMEGHEFEHYCAELLMANGFTNVDVTKGSGDFGADIIATKDMITYAIQCKAYSEPVGIKAIQEALCGREYYDCMIGAVLTNQYFTKAAIQAADKLKILLWDRDYLQQLISDAED